MPCLTALLLILALENPPVFEGAKLERVSGPMVPHWPDLAAGPGESGIQLEIRARSRRGAQISAVAVPTVPAVVEDRIGEPAGWKAYRVEAPAGATLRARLRSDHEAWFRVRTVNRWGQQEKGMLQNRIPTGNPEASFINSQSRSVSLYFVVDTADLGAEREPYRLEFSVK